MTATDPRAFHRFHSSRVQAGTAAAEQSSCFSSEPLSDAPAPARSLIALHRAAVAGDDFPARWARFLRSHFASPLYVAAHFDITDRAARKWWEAVGGPRGEYVALAFAVWPDAARAILIEGAA